MPFVQHPSPLPTRRAVPTEGARRPRAVRRGARRMNLDNEGLRDAGEPVGKRVRDFIIDVLLLTIAVFPKNLGTDACFVARRSPT